MTTGWQAFDIRIDRVFEILPSITRWARLEPLPTSSHLGPSLAAPVGDPLWLLNRQWAFGELQGEDAASPVDIRLEGESAVLSRYHPGLVGNGAADRSVDYAHLTLPLEVAVEHESAEDHAGLAAMAGQQACRMLVAANAEPAVKTLKDLYPLEIADPADAAADKTGAEWGAILNGRSVDGRKLAAALTPLVGANGTLSSLPPGLVTGSAAHQDRVKQALGDWMRWHRESISLPVPGEPNAWTNQRQEYALALSAQSSVGELVLRADEYTDGRLDWWSFLIGSGPSLGAPGEPAESKMVEIPSMLPAPARYPGMPADRFWEFEDGEVNLGSLEAGPGDLGRILLVEFGLVYGNDWWIVPVELPVGSLFKVAKLRVIDTFGETTEVGPSKNKTGPSWEMFELAQHGAHKKTLEDWFFLPPTLPRRLEGDPIERVTFTRDEMANLVWGIEHLTPGVSGAPVDRALEAAGQVVHQTLDTDLLDARLIYRLMTRVPTNWIPFAPVGVGTPGTQDYDLEFERRALLRTLKDGTTEKIHPAGSLLRSDPGGDVDTEAPLRIPEEEIRRDGIVVTRGFEYSRWFGGKSMLWMGKVKRTGRGEGSSGLRFDSADRVDG